MKSYLFLLALVGSFFLSGCGGANKSIQSTYWNANTASAMANEGTDKSQAEDDYLSALWRARNHLGDKEVSDSLYNLGQFYRKSKRLPEAIKYLNESIEIEHKVSDDLSVRFGRRYAELAMAYLMGENYNEARPYVDKIRNISFSGKEQEVANIIVGEFDKIMSVAAKSVDSIPEDPKEIFELATQYEDGRGVKQDFGEAIRLYKLSASKGFAHASYYVGVMYDKARGVEKNDVEARKWYREAADNGHAQAQFNYAVFLLQGRGGEKDIAEAKRYMTLSSGQGYAPATSALKRFF